MHRAVVGSAVAVGSPRAVRSRNVGSGGRRGKVLGAPLRCARLSPLLPPTARFHPAAQKLRLVLARPHGQAHAGVVGRCGSEVDARPGTVYGGLVGVFIC